MHGYGTNLEGPFPVVSRAIEACHEAVHAMGVRTKGGRAKGWQSELVSLLSSDGQAPRIATDIRIGTRTDKPGPGQAGQEQWAQGLGENERKRESVRRTLAEDSHSSSS